MKILFVCTGNLCRSPMAEVLLRSALVERGIDEVVVASSGTWGVEGEPATRLAVQTMHDRSIDLSEHRARDLDPSEVEAADLVIAMTSVHVREIGQRVPEAMPKVVLLKELAELEPEDLGPVATPQERLGALLSATRPRWRRSMDVDDPMGLPPHVYERCADELEAGITRLLTLLFPDAQATGGSAG